MNSLTNDLSKITTIPELTLNKLSDKAQMCIAHAALNLGDDPVSIDIGIGTLTIGNRCGEIRYKFIPSKSLEQAVSQAVSGYDSLTMTCEQILVDRIINTYKTMF